MKRIISSLTILLCITTWSIAQLLSFEQISDDLIMENSDSLNIEMLKMNLLEEDFIYIKTEEKSFPNDFLELLDDKEFLKDIGIPDSIEIPDDIEIPDSIDIPLSVSYETWASGYDNEKGTAVIWVYITPGLVVFQFANIEFVKKYYDLLSDIIVETCSKVKVEKIGNVYSRIYEHNSGIGYSLYYDINDDSYYLEIMSPDVLELGK